MLCCSTTTVVVYDDDDDDDYVRRYLKSRTYFASAQITGSRDELYPQTHATFPAVTQL